MKIVVHGNTPFAWTSAVHLAGIGHTVTLCADWSRCLRTPDAELAREPGLLTQLHDLVPKGLLTLSSGAGLMAAGTSDVNAVAFAIDQHWLALGGSADELLAYAQRLESERGTALAPLVVLSPYPLGTLARLKQAVDAMVYALPIFARGGSMLSNLAKPPLLVIGCDDEAHTAFMLETLRPMTRRAGEVMLVPLAAAELIKSSVNAMLATRMSFMNEMATLCESVGVDIDLVRQGLAADPRIGSDYLDAGCGFGGPSFSDELLDFSRSVQASIDQQTLIANALRINERQRDILFRKLWRYFEGDLSGRCFAIWGAAYKPNSASVQDSAVHPLLQALWAQGARTRVYDPLAAQSLRECYPDQPLLEIVDQPYDVLNCSSSAASAGADALIVVTAWEIFQSPDYARIRAGLRQPFILDGRNVYNPDYLREQGFTYVGIGRGDVF
ncbi:UDP binding domain-containing protein [Paraperlucidibaca sp.]|jgi:UDPglucose 6-dehydrogenase|uniref:UDP binding domain-containing protein n=1 Tax=Paraperlucidibaca sp. TaxID=2708021 RepID=UPI003988D8E6